MPIQYGAIALGQTILVSFQKGYNHFEDVAISMLKNVPTGTNTKNTYKSLNFLFHVVVDNQFVFLCAAEPEFGKRAPFMFLEEVKNKFNGTTLPSRAVNAYSHEFDQDFQHVLSQEMDKQASGDTGDKLSELRSQVDDVRGVMTQNIEKVLQRGENVENLLSRTESLEGVAEQFKSTGRKLHRKYWWRNVKMWIILGLIGVVILTVIILFATDTIPTK